MLVTTNTIHTDVIILPYPDFKSCNTKVRKRKTVRYIVPSKKNDCVLPIKFMTSIESEDDTHSFEINI